MKNVKLIMSILLLILVAQKKAVARCVTCYLIDKKVMCTYYENLSCADWHFGPNTNTAKCQDFLLVPNKPPIIILKENGKAYINNNGEIIAVASDRLDAFVSENKKLSEAEFTKQIKELLANDDGKVSIERIRWISKDLNARIEKSIDNEKEMSLSAKEVIAKDGVNCQDGYTSIDGRCIPTVIINAPWLNMKTGQIKYFEYPQDFVIDNSTLCNDLGVKQIVIAKGKYEVDYTNPNAGGKIRLLNTIPIKLPTGKPIMGRVYEGTYPKGKDCNGFGNTCFFTAEPVDKAALQAFIVTPVFENGFCIAIEVQYKGAGSPKNQGF